MRHRFSLAISARPISENSNVPAIHTDDEIRGALVRLEGEEIATLQVLGINSLKSISRTPEAEAGNVIESTSVAGSSDVAMTSSHQIGFNLQRPGRLVWL